ncbi:MAG: 2-oxoacid:acceptor oxidoreductase family protein [Eggerthellaceae bacterium]|nr:2-oxoacid:acceptor oxidoreductase family protein [Eggerthellaceae bacterium]
MEEMRIVFAGFGGQGLLFAGKVVAYAGLIDNHEVSWLPSYGPEMRGGTANCSVTLSDEPIGSPLIMNPNVLIAMNNPSLIKFESEVTPGGKIFIDTSLINRMPERDDVEVYALEATNMAEEEGLKGLANIVLVGKMLKETGFCTYETIEKAIRKTVPPRKAALIDKNLQALKLGMDN